MGDEIEFLRNSILKYRRMNEFLETEKSSKKIKKKAVEFLSEIIREKEEFSKSQSRVESDQELEEKKKILAARIQEYKKLKFKENIRRQKERKNLGSTLITAKARYNKVKNEHDSIKRKLNEEEERYNELINRTYEKSSEFTTIKNDILAQRSLLMKYNQKLDKLKKNSQNSTMNVLAGKKEYMRELRKEISNLVQSNNKLREEIRSLDRLVQNDGAPNLSINVGLGFAKAMRERQESDSSDEMVVLEKSGSSMDDGGMQRNFIKKKPIIVPRTSTFSGSRTRRKKQIQHRGDVTLDHLKSDDVLKNFNLFLLREQRNNHLNFFLSYREYREMVKGLKDGGDELVDGWNERRRALHALGKNFFFINSYFELSINESIIEIRNLYKEIDNTYLMMHLDDRDKYESVLEQNWAKLEILIAKYYKQTKKLIKKYLAFYIRNDMQSVMEKESQLKVDKNILNDDYSNYLDSELSPYGIVKRALTSLINMIINSVSEDENVDDRKAEAMLELRSPQTVLVPKDYKVITLHDFRRVRSSKSFSNFLLQVAKLKRVTSRQLENMEKEKLRIFFVNLFNLISLHAIITHPEMLESKREMSKIWKMGYRISDLTIDLRGIITKVFLMRIPAQSKDAKAQDEEPRVNFGLSSRGVERFSFPSVDYRMYFVLFVPTVFRSPLRIYSDFLYEDKWNQNTMDYIRKYIKFDEDTKTMEIPKELGKLIKKELLVDWIRKWVSYDEDAVYKFYKVKKRVSKPLAFEIF